MLELKEDTKKIADEKEIQTQLNNAIDNNYNFVFDAGAGAGKTYALIESLKYIVDTYGHKLAVKNQSILCITYTNAAADNIKLNFGNSHIVQISTIHERIWELIFLHQDVLLIEHEKKIEAELSILKQAFTGSSGESWLNESSSDQKESFREFLLQTKIKELFYNSTDHNSDFKEPLLDYGYTLNRNLGKFRDVVKYIYKTAQLEKCLNLIRRGEYKEVKYNANFNNDRLHYMMISHDTLLEYGLALCQKYPMFRRIVVDSFPYVLIDEYQDTDPNVIKFMFELTKESEGKGAFLVGYYGDKMQSIYDKGVSNDLHKYHSNLLCIDKKYNRRSRNEIIKISDSLRNDKLKQETIYENNDGGSFSFYQLVNQRPHDSFKLVNKFIESHLVLPKEEEIHCLVLKNEMLAELSGFKNLFVNIKDFFFYNEQAQKLISRDLNKLDGAIRVIFELMSFRDLMIKTTKTLEDILPKEKLIISMFEAKEYLDELTLLARKDANTLKDYLINMFESYENGSIIYKSKLKEFFPPTEFEYSLDGFIQLLNSELSSAGDVKDEDRIDKIKKILDLDLVNYIKWFEFVNDSSPELIKYHTYHSTKGLEYKNVVIIMENSFNRKTNYFPEFFKSPNNIDFQSRRNLLYVTCSRAICNMRILYLDDISSFKNEIGQFFGQVSDYHFKDE